MSPALETTPVSLKSTVSMLLFQTVFYGVIFLLVFWIFTLNWTWLIVSAIVTFLQLFIKNRSQTYINFVLDFLKPQ
jgi:VIT1/CCC1 family predicted Fe2+/Mn2+ transporter